MGPGIVIGGRFFKGVRVLTAGQVLGYACSVVRNIVLARLLTKADFGLATAFAMTIVLLEWAGQMGVGLAMVQSEHGEDARFQSVGHGIQMLAALLSAAVIVLASGLIAQLFSVPDRQWAFAWLAVVPLFKGFEHLDIYRRQRRMEFSPTVICEVVPQLLITAVVVPLALWLQDFRVVLWLLAIKAGTTCLLSHVVSVRRYRWAWDRPYLAAIGRFGWPLLLNALLLFVVQQGDQVVVGAVLSLDLLAGYALAVTLVTIPALIFGKVALTAVLPMLSRIKDDSARFQSNYRRLVQHGGLVGVVVLMPLIVFAEPVVVGLFGDKYSGVGVLVAILGIAGGLRMMRMVPVAACMARGDTRTQLVANLFRGCGLAAALLSVALGGGPIWVAVSAVVGEVAALAACLGRLRRCHQVRIRVAVPAVGFVALAMLAASVSMVWQRPPGSLAVPVFYLACLGGLAAAVASRLFPREMAEWREMIAHSLGRVG